MKKMLLFISLAFLPFLLCAQTATQPSEEGFNVFGIRLEFIFFGLTLLGVAIFHNKTLVVALIGLVAITLLRLTTTSFNVAQHLEEEWSILVNLAGLLLGFAVLAKHFEESGTPDNILKFLPSGRLGAFILLVFIFIISAFLDNIAAALIGGTIALVVFKGKVHIGYIAAIVAASNAGGSGSVVGDTTTTMMWIDGVSPFDIFHAYIAAVPALLIFGFFAARQQHHYQPIMNDQEINKHFDWKKMLVCIVILFGAIITNILLNLPAAGVWFAILTGALFVKTPWQEIPKAIPGALFLLALVLCASMMPVDQLPPASWQSAFALGFISAVFDNIPLTKLALDQGGFDWGILAYAVGFGGSMLWFGSSAGVALTSLFPGSKSVTNWLKNGWHVVVAYVIGFFIVLGIAGWHAHAPHKTTNNFQQKTNITQAVIDE